MLKLLVLAPLLLATLHFGAAYAQDSQSQPLTAIDIAARFAQGASADDILHQALFANTRVEPEYLGIAFFNENTGQPLDDNEIRELMGPVRQDGAYQLLEFAMASSAGQLPYSEAQLRLLIDAAFLASMRRPPEHIGVEFYDTREGPSGNSGGVSGRVPEDSPPAPQATQQTTPQQDAMASPEHYIPETEEALMRHLQSLSVAVTPRPGQAALPVIVGSQQQSALQSLLKAETARLERAFQVQQVNTIHQVIDEPTPGVYRLTAISFFSGEQDLITQLNEELNGVFYISE